eukprot:3473439-Rhodomonas_salina.1
MPFTEARMPSTEARMPSTEARMLTEIPGGAAGVQAGRGFEAAPRRERAPLGQGQTGLDDLGSICFARA